MSQLFYNYPTFEKCTTRSNALLRSFETRSSEYNSTALSLLRIPGYFRTDVNIWETFRQLMWNVSTCSKLFCFSLPVWNTIILDEHSKSTWNVILLSVNDLNHSVLNCDGKQKNIQKHWLEISKLKHFFVKVNENKHSKLSLNATGEFD